MSRSTLVAIIALVVSVSIAQAVEFVVLHDEFDDRKLVRDVSDQEAVKAFCKELEEFEESLLKKEEQEIEKLLGKPAARARKTYAMPVAQPRVIGLSGLRYLDEKLNKDHTEFYPVEDFAGVEVWYSNNGTSPAAVVVYLKVDKGFPKLTAKNLKERLAWDRERFAKLVKTMEDRQAAATK